MNTYDTLQLFSGSIVVLIKKALVFGPAAELIIVHAQMGIS